ncbi:MAG: hypothetical protein AAF583_13490 [Pseudomonadota bacterium]
MMKTSRPDFRELSKGKAPAPFSLRLSFEERARLEAAADGAPLGAYIRSVLFAQDLPKARRKRARPIADHRELARVLAALGASRLSSNVNQLAKAVNIGVLPVTPDTEAELHRACQDIAEMRDLLIAALGLEPSDLSGGPS